MHFYKGNPSNWPYICIVWSPTVGNLMTPVSLPSGELTWQLKFLIFNRRCIFTRPIFCCYVSLLEGSWEKNWTAKDVTTVILMVTSFQNTVDRIPEDVSRICYDLTMFGGLFSTYQCFSLKFLRFPWIIPHIPNIPHHLPTPNNHHMKRAYIQATERWGHFCRFEAPQPSWQSKGTPPKAPDKALSRETNG